MAEEIITNGKCLCGGVKVAVPVIKPKMCVCHCDMCRRWGGGPLLSVDCGTDSEFEGEENVAVYDSSAWAERGFCKQCGTHLFYRVKENQNCFMPVGLFDGDNGFEMNAEIFIDEKPDYYCFDSDVPKMTGEEAFAAFTAE